ncbi:MAG: hypothetical protein HKN33_15945 [Pyrinomonadaceae bacterium]|nr:hypothetical protein [Pyrinomonadaceae bacterium]
MSFKSFSKTLLIGVFVFAFTGIAFAQSSVAGRIFFRVDSATFKPVSGIQVKCFRIDVKESCGTAVTDSAGKFSFSGIDAAATFGLGLSGEGYAATYFPEMAVSNPRAQNLFIEISKGDGKEAAEDTLRKGIAGEGLSADEKAQRDKDELDRQSKFEGIIDIKARTERMEKLMAEGNAAFNSGDFATAEVKYKQGYETDPEYLGSAPTFLVNRSKALKNKGVDNYNAAVKTKNKAEISKQRTGLIADLMEAVKVSLKTLELTGGEISLDSIHAENNKKNATEARKSIIDSFKILGQLNVTFPANTEEEAKGAVDLHMSIMKFIPEDPGVLSSLMLSLYNKAIWGDDPSYQKSLNYGAYYLKKAPSDHNRRAAVKQMVELLQTENGLKAQPIN